MFTRDVTRAFASIKMYQKSISVFEQGLPIESTLNNFGGSSLSAKISIDIQGVMMS